VCVLAITAYAYWRWDYGDAYFKRIVAVSQSSSSLHLTGGYYHVPDEDDFDLSSESTVAFWFWDNDLTWTGSYERYVNHWSPGWFVGWVTDSGNYKMGIWPEVLYTTFPNIKANEWHHIAFTRNASFVTVYYDGVQTNQHSSAAVSASAEPLTCHGEAGPTADRAYGGIDELGLWNRVLSAAEIADIALTNRYITGNVASNIVALYHFDTGTGTNIIDSGPGGYDGGLFGSVSWGTNAFVWP